MTKSDSLLGRLRAIGADDREIWALLNFNFPGAGQSSIGNGKIALLEDGSEDKRLVTISHKHGKLTGILPGTALQSHDDQGHFIEKAKTELAPTYGSHVLSRHLFTTYPLQEVFSWKDRLRLRPCSPTTIIGKGRNWYHEGMQPLRLPHEPDPSLGPPYPLLMEVRVDKSPNHWIEANRGMALLDTFQYALTLLLVGDVRYAIFPNEEIWAAMKADRPEPEYHIVTPGFGDPEGGMHDDFPDCQSPTAQLYQQSNYYERLWPGDTTLKIPATLASHLEKLFQLPGTSLRKFRRACYWYSLGIQHRAAQTLSIPAFSAAIECLLPQPRASNCGECGKPNGLGPSKLFKLHLDRYGKVSPELEKQSSSLYDVRSALLHGRRASVIDYGMFSFDNDSRWHNILMWSVARRSLIGWLEDSDREVWHLK